MILNSTLSDQRKYNARSRRDNDRLVLHVTCQTHEGAAGFTNLVVTRSNNTIALNPHADNSCVLTLDEATANVLYETLGDWLEGARSTRFRSATR